jgi:hypothetical protein
MPLEKIDDLFDAGHKPWKAHAVVMKQTRDHSRLEGASAFEKAEFKKIYVVRSEV